MKTILKNGKYNVATCGSCQCEFSFDEVDINENKKVTCPQCGTECTIQEKPSK